MNTEHLPPKSPDEQLKPRVYSDDELLGQVQRQRLLLTSLIGPKAFQMPEFRELVVGQDSFLLTAQARFNQGRIIGPQAAAIFVEAQDRVLALLYETRALKRLAPKLERIQIEAFKTMRESLSITDRTSLAEQLLFIREAVKEAEKNAKDMEDGEEFRRRGRPRKNPIPTQ